MKKKKQYKITIRPFLRFFLQILKLLSLYLLTQLKNIQKNCVKFSDFILGFLARKKCWVRQIVFFYLNEKQ